MIARNARRRAAARGLQAPTSAEERYVRELRGILRALHREVLAWAEPHLADFSHHVDASGPSLEIDMLIQALIPAMRKHVSAAFLRMVAAVKRLNERSLKALGVSVNDLRLGAVLEHAREANVLLVENAGRVYAKQVREIFMDPASPALRVEELRARLLERGNVSESRAELIARDHVLKVNGQINEIRQGNAGVTSYVWSTSRDERVRESHAELEGEVIAWASPPEPGHPGQDFQCRCVALPVIPGLDD